MGNLDTKGNLMLSLFSRTLARAKTPFLGMRAPIARFGGGGHHGQEDIRKKYGPIHAPRVADKIVWLNVVLRTGYFQRVPAFEGETIMKALLRVSVPDVTASCEGGEDLHSMSERPIDPLTMGPFCGNCHIIIPEPWFKRLERPHPLETRNIEEASYPTTPHSRLACCLIVDKSMNEMTVMIGVTDDLLEEELVQND
eukprot:TRINITY_DN4055_c0_g2_i3.p1 TRINITY_DN4055_c0_g2~~TRINITY_DN4055_c0_g2_i3.p1  ORF type:complete len:230 (-),score=70.64 TRINITY_DN4055_c0_g2_i3:244-834(-)